MRWSYNEAGFFFFFLTGDYKNISMRELFSENCNIKCHNSQKSFMEKKVKEKNIRHAV